MAFVLAFFLPSVSSTPLVVPSGDGADQNTSVLGAVCVQ